MNNYFMETHHHEWILTNKLGGYALGTGNLINQRKYHGLLIASDKNFQRRHLVAGIEEKVEWRGEVINLDSNNYSNCIYPEGFLYLVKPWLRPYPIFLYSALPHQNDILIRKEIMMDENSNTVLIKYTNLGHHKLHFEFHPKYTMINHHEINAPGSLDAEAFETKITEEHIGVLFDAKRVLNESMVYGYVQKGEVSENRYSFYNVFYPWEVMNGYPGVGDQIALFDIRFDLGIGEENYILFSDRPLTVPSKIVNRILKRYEALPIPHDYPNVPDSDDTLLSKIDYNDSNLFNYHEYLKILEFALRDFISNDDIVAGYPWYGAWGRDTMFVLNTFLHSPKNLDMVERILMKYSRHLKDGLIPNMLPESGREVNYDSVDATLWYVILLYKLGKHRDRKAFWEESIHITEKILTAMISNKKYPYGIREDGLIELLPNFAHATWMDVTVDGAALTPRDGAPVEINALWYNAICSYEEMCNIYNSNSEKPMICNDKVLAYKNKIKLAFQKFWLDDYLADRLVGDEPVLEFRPNGLLATSLPWDLLNHEQMEKLFQKSFKELYTNYGIRSLSPNHFKYRKKYYGSQKDRDLAFHNGSVWAWLLGAFCGLYIKVYQDTKTSQEMSTELSGFVSTFRNSFMRGHIASVAEIWDGESPHFPKGAPAMAWSVAALYNIETYIAALEEKSK
jgi:predicted glycogen debranching enzyme